LVIFTTIKNNNNNYDNLDICSNATIPLQGRLTSN